MPVVHPLQNSFNSGEISPKVLARVDVAQYQGAAETALNLLCLPQGGYARRPGTRFVAEVKDSAAETKLIPFQFSTEQAYIIEAGNNYFRFFRNQGQIFADDTDGAITNGTFDTDISGWNDLSTGTASISHDGTNLWMDLNAATGFVAWAEQAVTIGAGFTGATHVLKFRVVGDPDQFVSIQIGTSSGSTDILNSEDYGPGWHCREFTPGVTTFYVQFQYRGDTGQVMSIDDISLIDNAPVEIGSPYPTANLTPVKTAQSADVMYIVNDGTIPVYKLQRKGNLSWSLQEVWFQDGPYLDENKTDTTLTASATTGVGITITASLVTGINGGAGFQSTDVGRIVRIQHGTNEHGYALITGYTSGTQVTADVKRDFNATTASTKWALGSWSDTTGYPSTVSFYEQRLVFANSTEQPQTLWMSQSADIENFRPDSFVSGSVTTEADDSLNFTIAAREVNAIRWLSAEKSLVMGTSGGEWVVGSSGASISPTDIAVKRHSTEGSADIQALLVNNKTIFVQRAKRKLFDYQFVFSDDRFQGRDITKIADHVTRSGVKEIHYQQQPDPLIWALRQDGVAAIVTYDPGQEVIGWTRVIIGGSFGSGNAVIESVGIIPGDAGGGRTYDSDERDEVWVIVKRTINGQTKRYIEFMEGLYEGPIQHDYDTEAAWKTAIIAAQEDSFYLDSGLTYDGAATTTISGLDHLEGETVKLLVDGSIHPDKVVNSGAVTLDFEGSKVHAGLGYDHQYKSVKINAGAAAGTAVGKVKRIHGITFVLLDTATFKYGRSLEALQDVEFREVGDAMDNAVPLFTGEKQKDFAGNYDRDARIHIKSDSPLPFFLLALAPEMKTNERV